MDLTIKQIKEMQKELKNSIEDKLREFNELTGVTVAGNIDYGYTDEKEQQFIRLAYSNPLR